MSEVRAGIKMPSFFELYSKGDVSADEVHMYVSPWHADEEPWAKNSSLHDYLGMTHAEYEVWLCDARSLPVILQARRSGRALVDVLCEYYAEMLVANRPADASALHSLGSWLTRHQGHIRQ